MNTVEQLQYIEHKWLPWFYYSASKKVMELLKKEGGSMFIDLLNTMNQDDPQYCCPFDAVDFRVETHIHSNVTFCQINMHKYIFVHFFCLFEQRHDGKQIGIQ